MPTVTHTSWLEHLKRERSKGGGTIAWRRSMCGKRRSKIIDTTGKLWQQGALADKAVTSFTGAMNAHGGQESTILALNNVFYHWGAIIVPTGYTDASIYAAGGNPYGTSNTASQDGVAEEMLMAARHQGARLARFATLIAQSRVNA